ncbi:helix-turn-helix domain-containing protein [Kitasatospora indigofera]|uniref:helix-turn-helix domain-containing protein n=1 Tax=Kitasatospora indigofera TaxID=67307 RepID=UPI00364892C5
MAREKGSLGLPDHPLLLIGLPALPACPIAPTAAERARLKKAAYGHKTEHRLRVSAQVVLYAARGRSNAHIARETGLHLDTVRKWRGRFAELSLAARADRKRPGRPRRFTALQATQVKALACQLPAETGAPLSPWSCPELAREAVARGIAAFVSASTVRRWLAEDALTPWQHRSWIFITDPGFKAKAERVLDLYARTWGRPLTRPGRVRHQRGRDDLHSGSLPLPPQPRPGKANPRSTSPHDQPPKNFRSRPFSHDQ